MIVMQTCDPHDYFALFAVTQPSAAAFAAANEFAYEAFIGVKRGYLPWHAAYNRIPMLFDLMESGNRGWVLYMDADSYIVDIDFNIRRYLVDKGQRSFIFAPGTANPLPWQVNDGIFFANLGSPFCREVILAWHEAFMSEVSDEKLRNSKGPFDIYPDDQQLLQSSIKEASSVTQESVLIDLDQTFNYQGGRFARQVIRAHHKSFSDRVECAKLEVLAALANCKPS